MTLEHFVASDMQCSDATVPTYLPTTTYYKLSVNYLLHIFLQRSLMPVLLIPLQVQNKLCTLKHDCVM